MHWLARFVPTADKKTPNLDFYGERFIKSNESKTAHLRVLRLPQKRQIAIIRKNIYKNEIKFNPQHATIKREKRKERCER